MIFHFCLCDQSKLLKSLLVGGQCLDRVMFCPKPFDFNDFSLKLTKYLMFPKSHFCVKVSNRASPENSSLTSVTPVCHVLPGLHNLVVVNPIVDKNPLRVVTLLLCSNTINSLNSEEVFYSIQFNSK